MNSKEIRQAFFDFFKSKGHQVVPSAPMVVKNDPTLMFTNAGMNQFKDIFLGNLAAKNSRVSDSQKCLRVSGKHNDLEEVGYDTYHHTMFEMLGNWSFGDYFKDEAIDWAWEFLTDVMKIDKSRLYVSVFEGDKKDGVPFDQEAYDKWLTYVDKDMIIMGNKKDNFWEMGDVGPCGPCSEIHVDIRSDEERAKVDGASLVNEDHPQVIEVWNLVFMQFNRMANGSLVPLPKTHVDTGMGFERLCMVLQGVQSNYDTDLFQPLIKEIEKISGLTYGEDEMVDTSMRVISDHIRTIAFSIADAQLPSNNKAGYVIRRILRRAVRYGHTYLGLKEPFMYSIVPTLIEKMGDAFPELVQQKKLIMDVTKEEEISFLKTLDNGIKLLDRIIKDLKGTVISGKVVFELYDTCGFPLDLTALILREKGFTFDQKQFDEAMAAQKSRSRDAAAQDLGDWIIHIEDDVEEFVGYDHTSTKLKITKYRKVKQKKGEIYHVVFNITPFYGESGGQSGDRGYIESNGKKYFIEDTVKENSLTIHLMKTLPEDIDAKFEAVVDEKRRSSSSNNHSATHLIGYVLREVLGSHIEQKGSLVNENSLRFDFSHFQKVSEEQLAEVQSKVNRLIRANIKLEEHRSLPIDEASKMGAVALFGEKYGDVVRVIKFGDSVEFCGGTHVKSTGEIGQVIILSEGSISSGIRRIEAITGEAAERYIDNKLALLKEVSSMLNAPKDIVKSVSDLITKNSEMQQSLDAFSRQQIEKLAKDLISSATVTDGITTITAKVDINNGSELKDLAFAIKAKLDRFYVVLGAKVDSKANIAIVISEDIVKEKELNAGAIIRTVSKKIKGGGGGQPFFATAGGKDPEGLDSAMSEAAEMLK